MTKKQINVMARILSRDITGHKVRVFKDRFIVTDGRVVIVSNTEIPDPDFENAEPNENDERIYSSIMNEIENGDYVLTQDDLASWRKVARSEKIVQIEGETSIGKHISGHFNTRYVVDAMDSVGTGSRLYIGKLQMFGGNGMCGLLVLPKDYSGGTPDLIGFVLPTRQKATN